MNKKKNAKVKLFTVSLVKWRAKNEGKMSLAISLYRREPGIEDYREACFICFFGSRAVKHKLKIY